MNLDLAIVDFALMTIANYWVARSVLYPPFIFCAMWLLDLAIYRCNFIEVDPLHHATLILICSGAAAFSAGGAAAIGVPKRLIAIHFKLAPPRQEKRTYKVVMLGLLACCIPHVMSVTMQLAAIGEGSSFFEKARNAAVDAAFSGQKQPDLIMDFFGTWTIYLAVLFMIDRRDQLFWVATLFALVANALGGGRTGLLTLIAALTTVYMIQTSRQNFFAACKVLRLPALLFLVLYIGLTFLNKDTSIFVSIGDAAKYFVVSYLIGPTAALDHVLLHPEGFATMANHSFEFFFKVASTLHLLQYVPPDRFEQFIFVPFPTNVFTIFKPYVLECGVTGVLAILCVLGFIHSLLYRKAWFSELGLFLFALSVYTAIMVIFDDGYFLGGYLRAACACIIFQWIRGANITLFAKK